MKLYATVKSERASKGQGGNDYLNIEITDSFGELIWTISAIPEKTPDHFKAFRFTLKDWVNNGREYVALIRGEKIEETKGKRQKGEHELKILSLHDVQASCKCGWYYAFTGEMTKELVEQEYQKHIK